MDTGLKLDGLGIECCPPVKYGHAWSLVNLSWSRKARVHSTRKVSEHLWNIMALYWNDQKVLQRHA